MSASKKNNDQAISATNKAFQVIAALDKNDRKQLGLFIESPYFNKSKILTAIYKALSSGVEAGQKDFVKENVWRKVFQNTAYNDVLFRKHCSLLLSLIEKFLAQQHIEQKDEWLEIDSLEYAIQKKITPIYNTLTKKIKEKSGSTSAKSSEFYHLQFRFESLLNKLSMEYNIYKSKSNYEHISDSIDQYFLIEKIRLLCSTIAQSRMVNVQYLIDFEDEIHQHIERENAKVSPTLNLYHLTYKILKDEKDVDSFYRLKQAILGSGGSIPPTDLRELVINAINFCTSKVNKGNSDFYADYFDFIEFGLSNNVFINEGNLDSWHFNNFVIIAIRLRKFDWVEDFIHRYKNFLNAQERESVVSFNLGRLYYNQKKFDQVLSTLKSVEYNDLLINLNSKGLLLSTYYEMKEFEALDYFMESFRVYLNRHKDLSLQRRKSFLNFIKFTRRLVRIPQGDKASCQKFRDDLRKEKSSMVNFDWLMEKVSEIE